MKQSNGSSSTQDIQCQRTPFCGEEIVSLINTISLLKKGNGYYLSFGLEMQQIIFA